MDIDNLREMMVDEQLIARGIKDSRVIEAFRKVRRHLFVPRELARSAYTDGALPIGHGQTISQPYIVALMTECLDIKGDKRVLEIGCGSGYQAAVLSKLAKEVFTVERIEELALRAEETLGELGYRNVKIKVADGSMGWPEEAPFDRIIVTAASPSVPVPLIEQLKEPGKMVLPIGESFHQVLTVVEKKHGGVISTDICGCVFVPLIGRYGNKQL